jgi:ATP-binding cassette, subfamily B, bacterial
MNSEWRFSTLLQYVAPYRAALILAGIMLLAESAISLINPLLAGLFTDTLISNHPEQFILPGIQIGIHQILLIWLFILALQAALGFGEQYLIGITGERMLAQLRVRIYDHLQSLPLGFFSDTKRGEVLTLITYDAEIISNFVTHTLIGLLPRFVTFFGALLFIYLIDPMIAALVGFSLPFFFIVMKLLGRRIRPLSRAMIDEYAGTFAILEENLQMLPVIKSFTREVRESKRFMAGNLRLLGLTARYLRIHAMMSPVVHFLAAAGILVLLWLSSDLFTAGELTAAQLVSLLLYGMLITRPISSLADVYGQLQHARGAAERLIDIFAVEPEPDDAGKPVLPPVKGAIEFRDIHFQYPGRDEILRGLSLTIAAGETVAITGVNGAGKSTLVHLLQRFADPQQGDIFIDDINISEVSLASLRNQIGYVQQNVILLNGTIRDNIAFGEPEADLAAIEAAAGGAHALAFIQELPQGFDTLIGDQGIKLSGGQKQRLALARALLKDPAILIMDEATAMFDPEGEKSFIQACHATLRQRTVILITHRPGSLVLADRILKLENGVVRETSAQAIAQLQ